MFYLNENEKHSFDSYILDYSMPCTFKMIPLKMSVTDIEGIQTFFFKVNIDL